MAGTPNFEELARMFGRTPEQIASAWKDAYGEQADIYKQYTPQYQAAYEAAQVPYKPSTLAKVGTYGGLAALGLGLATGGGGRFAPLLGGLAGAGLGHARKAEQKYKTEQQQNLQNQLASLGMAQQGALGENQADIEGIKATWDADQEMYKRYRDIIEDQQKEEERKNRLAVQRSRTAGELSPSAIRTQWVNDVDIMRAQGIPDEEIKQKYFHKWSAWTNYYEGDKPSQVTQVDLRKAAELQRQNEIIQFQKQLNDQMQAYDAEKYTKLHPFAPQPMDWESAARLINEGKFGDPYQYQRTLDTLGSMTYTPGQYQQNLIQNPNWVATQNAPLPTVRRPLPEPLNQPVKPQVTLQDLQDALQAGVITQEMYNEGLKELGYGNR